MLQKEKDSSYVVMCFGGGEGGGGAVKLPL